MKNDNFHTDISESCKVEASREKLALLYDFAPVGYFTFDRSGGILYVNLFGEKLLGVERGELLGRRFEEFVCYEERFLFINFLADLFNSQSKETCRLGLVQRDNRPLFVRIEGMVVENTEECMAVLLDITEKKLSEQALSESEYNLAKAQSMTHVGSWSYNPVTAEMSASDELLRIMHLRRDETTQEAFASVVHPDDYDNVMEHLHKGVEEGESYEIEHRLLFRDGTSRWVYTIVEPQLNRSGNVVKLYGTTQDISERKRIEVDLRNKTNELQAIFDSIGDGIAVYDHQGKVQHHNQISPKLFPGEIIQGESCSTIFHPDALVSPEECPVERALKGESVETSLVTHTGSKLPRYFDITATPIRDSYGEQNRALLFFRDVSEKRLQEMHLIQTEKMSSIGVLATGIAHEINNPLTSVAGCAEALLRRFRDSPELLDDLRLDVFPRYLQVIERESYRCKTIIEGLLSFGRKSDGNSTLFSINQILKEVLELICHHPNYRQIDVNVELDDKIPPIHGDPSALRQVCMNLIINAHQAITGSGVVTVTSEILSENIIKVSISDNGSGIAKENLDRIWDPFFTTKEVGKGLGLGLALTYNIVKRHGGEIRVASKAGEGSEFTLLLPF